MDLEEKMAKDILTFPTRLTTKTNNNWNFDSIVGQRHSAIICKRCGVFTQRSFDALCGDCFSGDKKIAQQAWVADKRGIKNFKPYAWKNEN